MKKTIILTVALTGLSVYASAQQKDFFDIQKYLQHKSKSKKEIIKKIDRNSFIGSFSVAPAQTPLNSGSISHSLPNGDKVVLLSIDNMPCVVTDMKKFQRFSFPENNSSIVFLNNTIGRIPNAIQPSYDGLVILK